MKKRIVAVDFGTKRCGLAISNETKSMALPWTTVSLSTIIPTIQKRKEEIDSIIVGLPLLMNGQKAEMAKAVEAFAEKLEIALELPIILFDERLSSKHAESALRETGQKRKAIAKKTDETAATFLLQSYLDANSKLHPAP